MKRYVAYLRVSTKEQGDHGHGLDAQREIVTNFVEKDGGKLLKEFSEVESGGKDDRPVLQQALNHCLVTGACLVIAKLDRLSRSVAFTSKLMDAGLEFIICDFPTANRLTIHVLAAMAEYERSMIKIRTKQGIKAAKAKGVVWGTAADQNRDDEKFALARIKGAAERKRKADNYADKLRPLISALNEQGINTYTGLAEGLNNADAVSPTGRRGIWTRQSVKNVLARLN